MFWDPLFTSDPFRTPGRLRTPHGALAQLLTPPRPRRRIPRGPAINLDANDDEAWVTALVPGLTSDQLDLTLEGDLLTLSGKLTDGEDDASEPQRRERFTGQFSRTVRLPFPCDREGIEATLERGLLEVRLPRAAEDRPRRIEITSR